MSFRRLGRIALLATLGFSSEPEPDLGCPPGSEVREHGTDFACETPAGVGEGPFWARRADGSLRLWGTARRGETDGRWIAWHPNGTKSIEATYRAGTLVGSFLMRDDEGRRIYGGRNDDSGEMDGTWRRWWPSGHERMRWEMRHGHAHGEVVAYFEDGGMRFEGRRENGRREGHWTWWNEAGDRVARCRYENDAVAEGTCGESSPE